LPVAETSEIYMSSQELETLSAMLDNEADELELRRILKRLEQDPELVEAWQRMSLVQAVLHDDNLRSRHVGRVDSRLSEAVSRAIVEEPVPPAAEKAVRRWTQPLAKLGVAASVAVAFFLGMQISVENQPGASERATPLVQQADSDISNGREDARSAPAAATLADNGGNEPAVQEVDPEARQRLENYIRSVSITREEPEQLEQFQDSPLYRLVNEIQDLQ